MKLRYKNNQIETSSSRFNTFGLGEVLTPDDSAIIKEMDAWIEALQQWKDMGQAFKDGDIIVDNYNEYFFEPKSDEDRKRGYTL